MKKLIPIIIAAMLLSSCEDREKECMDNLRYSIFIPEHSRIVGLYAKYVGLYIREKDYQKRMMYSDTCDMIRIQADYIEYLIGRQ